MKKNKQSTYIYGLLVFLCLIFIWLKVPLLGLVFLSAVFVWQANFFRVWVLKIKGVDIGSLSYFFLISAYVIGLSLVYYLFGLSQFSVLLFLLLFSSLALLAPHDASPLPFKKFFKSLCLSNPWHISTLAGLLFLLVYLVLDPVTNGSPTPWLGLLWPAVALFIFISLMFLLGLFSARRPGSFLPALAYLFFIVAIVPMRYVLSFGYDTLIHQGALAQIVASGRVFPLTPFYVGQYSLEILINFSSGLSFVFIERWLVPVFFVVFLFLAGRFLLDSFSRKTDFFILSLTALLFLPNFFYYSSPYALSLIFSLASVAFIYAHIKQGKGELFWTALVLALAALFIHPFVGLNVLIAALVAKKFSLVAQNQRRFWLLILFTAVALAVGVAFVLYNWVGGKIVYLVDPTYYLNNFLGIFGNPLWYVFDNPPWWLSLIYAYEKLNIFLVFFLGAWFVFRNKKKDSAGVFVFVLALGAFVSAWLFVSGFEVGGYSIGDQVNYSFRLLSSAKWFLFFPVLLCLSDIFSFLSKKGVIVKTAAIGGLLVLSIVSLYLTYPRNDAISRLGVNNIRTIDYEIINIIRQREGGKDGYLIFANQLFCGAAIQKYGFGPYYQSSWGQLFYCSTPMASETNQRFHRIMYGENFDPELINEVLRETGVDKAYLITTDYWRPSPLVEEQISTVAQKKIEVGDNNFVYFFSLK